MAYIFILTIIIGLNDSDSGVYDHDKVLQLKGFSNKLNLKQIENKCCFVQGFYDWIMTEEEYSAEGLNLFKYSFKKTIGPWLYIVNNQPRKKIPANKLIIFEADNSPPII